MGPVYVFASALEREVKWYGKPEKHPRPLRLRAGSLSMLYERGNLRHLLNGNEEIIRMIYPAVRDQEWHNVPNVRMQEEIKLLDKSFTIRYRCLYSLGDIRFGAEFTIEGKEDNTIAFSMEGEALSTFMKNRIGLCVLHPVKECTGIPCTIVHSDKTSEILHFPEEISPHQPFTDITSMIWKRGGKENILKFTGDIFETEDQRNWTDSSFKTYSTPLNLPHPVIISKGDAVFQKVDLQSQPYRNVKRPSQDVNNIILSPNLTYRLPQIGIGQSTRKKPLTKNEISLLRKIPFDHYRIDLYLFENSWEAKAGRGLIESIELGYSLEIALFFDEHAEKEAADFIKWSNSAKGKISVIHLFHRTCQNTPEWLIEKVVPILRKQLPEAALSGGTNSNFAQLNRNRINSDKTDITTYSIHPQEHASDNITIIENIDAQKDTVESAIKFNPGKKIWVSPVNIQRRFNANIENFEKRQAGSQLQPQVDCRLMSLLGAAWTTGSLKRIVCSGAGGITFYETAGERGIMQGDYSSRWAKKFKAAKGMIFPSFHVFKYILGNKSFRILKSESGAPLKTDHIILTDGSKLKMIMVNYTRDKQQIKIPDNMIDLTVRHMQEGNFADVVSDENWLESDKKRVISSKDQIFLEPYSVSFIDGGIKLR